MSSASKVKKVIYSLSAIGGGVTILSTVHKCYKKDALKSPKLEFGNQLKAECKLDKDDSNQIGSWNWPKWDWNWDKRQHHQGEKITARRHVILIRHGQFNKDGLTEKQKYLTELGESQASLTGTKLAEMNLPLTSIIFSNLTHATEATARIISERLPKVPVFNDEMIHDCIPCEADPPGSKSYPEQVYFTDGARIEAAFRKYFHRADASQKEDSYEVIICHSNVIRYFVCRALQFPPKAYLRLSMKHGSMTWLTIYPDGNTRIKCLGEAGHLEPEIWRNVEYC